MGSARNILYGLAATLLLFSGAVAIQRSYLSHLDSLIAAAQPGRDSKPGTPGSESPRLPHRRSPAGARFQAGHAWDVGVDTTGSRFVGLQ